MDKRKLSRLHLPRPLCDLITTLAAQQGFGLDEIQFFLYDLLKRDYPKELAEVEQQNGYPADWLSEYEPGKWHNGE